MTTKSSFCADEVCHMQIIKNALIIALCCVAFGNVVALGETFSTHEGPHAGATSAEYVIQDGFEDDGWFTVGSDCDGCGNCEQCRVGWFNKVIRPACPRWTAQIDALMLWQNNIPSRPLFGSPPFTPPEGPTVLDADQLQTPMSAGPRLGLQLHLDNCFAIEGNWLLVDGFNGFQTLPGPGPYDHLDIAGLNFDNVTSATVSSGGRLQSAELNWRRRADLVTWLAGFRWVQWNARLDIANQFSQTTGTILAGTDTVNVLTGNDLYGGQVGADIRVWEIGRWLQLSSIGKAGIFYNPAYQRTVRSSIFTTGGPDATVPGSGQADQTSFFGEVGLNANVNLRSWLSWHIGYSLFWLSGVATPAEQLSEVDLVGTGTLPILVGINTNGSVFLHGVTTGIEARW